MSFLDRRLDHSQTQATEIAVVADELDKLRNGPLNPRSGRGAVKSFCNQRPAWLDHAHRRLDAAVFAAYAWPGDLTDGETLARLLELNSSREAFRESAA
jgi:hypothetical protein